MKNDLLIPAIAWILLTVLCITAILLGLRSALKRTDWKTDRRNRIFTITLSAILSWTALLLILSYNGFFGDSTAFPPKPALAMLVPLPIVLMIAFSKAVTQLLKVIPAQWLIFMQSFRIAVELLLLMAFINGKLPVQMTFEGRNFDILTGILAIPVGYIVAKNYSPKLAIAFNIIGVLLLINILVVAILSMPSPIRYFMNEPANILVAQFPFILLPGVLVPIAYTMHIFSLRQLLIREKTSQHLVGAIS